MFDLFKIGFLTVSLMDILDIAIVTYITYRLYMLLKGTIAAQIFMGLIIVFVLYFIANALNLRALTTLLKLVTDIWVIVFVILFQPEIRRLLVIVARNRFFTLFVKSNSPQEAEIITEAAFEMSQHQHGALMILVKSTGIRGYTETGEQINAKLSKDLIRTIFFPRSALHDGAVVIKNDVIEAARCTLPLSTTTSVNGEALGMRHRAGLGISEQADVISVIVSEETGGISVAENGTLIRGLSKDALRKKLSESFRTPSIKGWKAILELLRQKK